jgi:hypothetical protein
MLGGVSDTFRLQTVDGDHQNRRRMDRGKRKEQDGEDGEEKATPFPNYVDHTNSKNPGTAASDEWQVKMHRRGPDWEGFS